MSYFLHPQTQTLIRKRLKEIFYINELYTTVFKNINSKRKTNSSLDVLLRQCLFLVIFKFLFFFMLFFFSQQNPTKPNYLIQNLALMMVQNTKTTGIRSIDFSCIRSYNHKKERKWSKEDYMN